MDIPTEAVCAMSSQGRNGVGQVGDGTTITPFLPTLVSDSGNWSTLALGTAASCATNSNGTLYCWGSNQYGQLGDNTTTNHARPTAAVTSLAWTSVSLGAQALCGVVGAPLAPPPQPVFPPAPPRYDAPNCWGTNSAGQFANGSASGSRLAPTNVSSTVWQQFSLSDTTACAIQQSVLALYCWGSDTDGLGSLGDGSAASHYMPLQVSGGGQWRSVFAGSGWGCGIRTNGSLNCWGYNGLGGLGDNTTTDSMVPVLIGSSTWASLPPRGYGGFFTCGIQSDSSLWCWVRQYASSDAGFCAYGQV